MRKQCIFLATIMVLIADASYAAHSQYWTQNYLNYTPVKDMSSAWSGFWISASADYRFDDYNLYYFEHAFTANYRCCPYFWVSAAYVYARNRPQHVNPFVTENRFQFDLNGQAPDVIGLRLDMRFRMEFRNIHHQTMFNRYRVRPRLRTAQTFTDFRIRPYISNEFFFSNKENYEKREMFDHDRFQCGIEFKPFPDMLPGIEAAVFYQLLYEISDYGHEYRQWNCFCLALTYKF